MKYLISITLSLLISLTSFAANNSSNDAEKYTSKNSTYQFPKIHPQHQPKVTVVRSEKRGVVLEVEMTLLMSDCIGGVFDISFLNDLVLRKTVDGVSRKAITFSYPSGGTCQGLEEDPKIKFRQWVQRNVKTDIASLMIIDGGFVDYGYLIDVDKDDNISAKYIF